jgi:hypothetical protein
MSNIQTEILNRVQRDSKGKVFTSKDFLDLGSKHSFNPWVVVGTDCAT